MNKVLRSKLSKKNILAWPILASFLYFCYAGTLTAQDIIFVGEAVPPLIVMDEEKHKSGALVELAQALIEHTNIDASIALLPWARAYEMGLNDANVILLAVLKTDVREPQFQWIGKVHQAKAHLIGLKNRPDIRISKLAEARNLRLGSVRGYGSVTHLLNNGFTEGSNLVLVSNTAQMWGLLFNDRVDLVLANYETSLHEILSIGYDQNSVKDIFEITELSHELHFATGHQTSKALVEILGRGLSALKENGTYGAIKSRWGLSTD